jgi:hypothetical protein
MGFGLMYSWEVLPKEFSHVIITPKVMYLAFKVSISSVSEI